VSRRSFDSVSVGETLPELRKVVTREDITAYAEASLDRNPLHLDDEAARARGFDGIIGHGMFTMAHLTTCVTEWAGDVGAIARIKAAFRAAVVPGDEMVAGGSVTSLDPDTRRAKLEVWVTVDRDGTEEQAVRRGSAVVQLG
jgi:acyl dehydratase